MIHILTLSNKPTLLPQAEASVKAQTRGDWQHHVALDCGLQWDGRYPPAVYYNETTRLIPLRDYVCWLSDDDVLLPNFCADLGGYLDAHPECGCVYGSAEQYLYVPPGPAHYYRTLPADQVYGAGHNAGQDPAGHVDGGQFLLRRSVLDRISYPWVPEREMARCSDGVLMNKIASACGMQPLPVVVVHLRTTPLSANVATDDGVTLFATEWRERRWTA